MPTLQLLPDTLSAELESFTALDGFLDKNQQTVSTIPLLMETHTDLKTKLALIPAESVRRNELKTGHKGVKIQNRQTTAHAAFIVLKALRVTGKRRNIDELKNIRIFTEKLLARMRFIQLGEYCSGLYDLMVKYKVALTALNIGDEQITAFNTGVNQYKTKITQLDIERGLGESSTEQILKLFMDTEDIVDDICDIFDSLMDRYPVFYREFKQVIQIRAYGARHRKNKKENGPSGNSQAGSPAPGGSQT